MTGRALASLLAFLFVLQATTPAWAWGAPAIA